MEVVATLRNSIEERISELRSSEEAWQHINFMCIYIYISTYNTEVCDIRRSLC